MVGWLLALAGDWTRGMELLRDAARRNPYCLSQVKHGLCADHLHRDEVIAGLREAGLILA
jgi:hypothetical protein